MKFIDNIKFWLYQKKWRKNNSHNNTIPVNKFPEKCVSVGNETYGNLYVLAFNDNYKLSIGHYCSIAPNVAFMLSAEHNMNHFSSYPFKVKIIGSVNNEGISKGNIQVDDDVWIGYGAIIMSGVHIGQGAVVAAGAVVTKNIPPYAIVAGTPAKVIRYRFNDEIISQLLSIDYSRLTHEMIIRNEEELYEDIKCVEQIERLCQL